MDAAEDSFVSAWSKARFPDQNRPFVKWFCDEIGVMSYEFVPADYRYIRALRRDGTGELRIYWGVSSGFTEGEAQLFGADADEVRPATKHGRTWLISHPEHRDVFLRGSNANTKKQEPSRCPRCRIYELSVTGACPGCDD